MIGILRIETEERLRSAGNEPISPFHFYVKSENGDKIGIVSGDEISSLLKDFGFKIVKNEQ